MNPFNCWWNSWACYSNLGRFPLFAKSGVKSTNFNHFEYSLFRSWVDLLTGVAIIEIFLVFYTAETLEINLRYKNVYLYTYRDLLQQYLTLYKLDFGVYPINEMGLSIESIELLMKFMGLFSKFQIWTMASLHFSKMGSNLRISTIFNIRYLGLDSTC